MHTELWHTCIDRPHAHRARQHRPHGASASTIVSDLEDLQLGTTLVGDTLEESGADAISRSVAVWICLDGNASIKPRRVVFQIYIHKVGIHGMRNIGRYHEAIRVHLGHNVGAKALFGECFAYALEGTWKKVAMGTLA